MIYYKITTSNSVNGIIPPGLNGTNVKNKHEFFDNGKCGPDLFYDQLYEFDYLTPLEFGDDLENGESTLLLFDLHLWHGDYPIGGWLKPVSKKFKNLLESYNLGEHRFYPASVLFKNARHEYYVLQILRNFYQNFDSLSHLIVSSGK